MRCFHAITSGHNCGGMLGPTMESILKQNIPKGWDLRIHAIDDNSSDFTWSRITSYRAEGAPVIAYSNDDRKGAAYSRMRALRSSHVKSGDVAFLVGLDGDTLAHEGVLERVAVEYDMRADMTYGSWRFMYDTDGWPHWVVPYTKEELEDVRTAPWKCQPLQTFLVDLVWDLPDESFQLEDGTWLPACTELALLIPAMERSEKMVFIRDLLYIYNDHRKATRRIYGEKKKEWYKYICTSLTTPPRVTVG